MDNTNIILIYEYPKKHKVSGDVVSKHSKRVTRLADFALFSACPLPEQFQNYMLGRGLRWKTSKRENAWQR